MTSACLLTICLLAGAETADGPGRGLVRFSANQRNLAIKTSAENTDPGTPWVPSRPARERLPGDDADRAVESGRKALGHWRAYPWYDSSDDALRPINLPKPSRPWNVRPWVLPGGLFQWLAWMLLAAALTAVVVFLLSYGRRAQLLEARRTAADPAVQRRRVAALPLPAGRSHDNLLAEAERCYREGNYREAVIYLFSHELVELDRRHFIHLARGKTNRQYLREIGRAAPLRRIVDRTMVAFEDVFFGNRPLDRMGFEACWSELPRFDAMLAEGALGGAAGG